MRPTSIKLNRHFAHFQYHVLLVFSIRRVLIITNSLYCLIISIADSLVRQRSTILNTNAIGYQTIK